jgi:hypothetical protein
MPETFEIRSYNAGVDACVRIIAQVADGVAGQPVADTAALEAASIFAYLAGLLPELKIGADFGPAPEPTDGDPEPKAPAPIAAAAELAPAAAR